MKELCDEQTGRPLRTALYGLGILSVAALGQSTCSNYLATPEKIIKQGNEIKITRMYSPLSYLEQTSEGGKVKEISQKSLLTNSLIIRFKLTPQGKVEEMVQDSAFYGKPNLKSAYPGDGRNIDWDGVNQTAQNYIAYFKK